MPEYRTRFAPSPTGPLHLGHAYSALTAFDRAQALGGEMLLRIEDIDPERTRPEWDAGILEDLAWLGITWPEPVLRQSARLPLYRAALDTLAQMGVSYPCSCTRHDIRAAMSAPQDGVPQHGPDGLIYPGTCRERPMAEARPGDAIRLDIGRAMALAGSLFFQENGPLHGGPQKVEVATMVADAGDVVLARRGQDTSYHLSVVVDDAEQGITEVVRGADLFDATSIHVLLQQLLHCPRPSYYHHALIRDEHGKRLAKRDDARAIRLFRAEGASPDDIRRMVGL